MTGEEKIGFWSDLFHTLGILIIGLILGILMGFIWGSIMSASVC